MNQARTDRGTRTRSTGGAQRARRDAGAGSTGERGRDDSGTMSEPMLVCIQNCQDCYRACLQTLGYCMEMGGRHAEPEHLGLMMDCADICHTAANFMIRESELHAHVCLACAEVCQRCADDCERMADDLRMKACADTCRHCAESCRAMATAPGAVATVPRGPRRATAVMSRKKTD